MKNKDKDEENISVNEEKENFGIHQKFESIDQINCKRFFLFQIFLRI